jgi:membrane associated rhomboid family serine protease
MFPVGDDDSDRGGAIPFVTWGLIALNVLAFLLEINRPSEAALQSFIQAWGVVPREYAQGRDLAPLIPAPFWTTLLTSMFLHGGWLHLGGNMLYLWIFGDNLERAMGAIKFGIFYMVCGLAASAAHILFNLNAAMPAVGASGAISGVLGGYLLLFPKNRVRVLTRAGVTHVPALVVLGLWIVLQLFSGIGTVARTSETGGGVAYMAHIGGFAAGLLLVKLFAARRSTAL